MASVIIRVELLGEPGGDVYKKLHEFMTNEKGWQTYIKSIDGHMSALPHAMYCGNSKVDDESLAKALKASIVPQIWKKGALVMVINWSSWALL